MPRRPLFAMLEDLTHALGREGGVSLVVSMHDTGKARALTERVIALEDGRIVLSEVTPGA